LLHGGIYRRRQYSAFAVMFNRGRVFFDPGFHRFDPPGRPERVQRPVDRDPVRPRRKPGIAPIRRQRLEDLDPHFLRHVLRRVGVADQPPDHRVDARCVQRPELAHGLLIAAHGTLDECLILMHHVLSISVT
jgi:hypothetical protein